MTIAPMKTLLLTITLPLLQLLCLTHQPQAAVIAYDNFDYAANQSISGLSGGAGFNSNWSIRGGGAIVTSTAGITVTPTSSLYATRGINVLTTGTYYFSFIVDNVSDGGRFTAFSLVYTTGASNTGAEQTYIGQASGSSLWNINAGSGVTHSNYSNPNNGSRASRPSIDPTLMVLKVEFDYNGTGQERLSLYLNPDLNGIEPASPHVITFTDYLNGINAIWAGSGFDNGTQTTAVTTYDNIRLTTTWAELANAPEPTYTTLLLTGLSLTALRRRRTIKI